MGREETVISQLAELYESYGYSYYKVSRFEEYDLYARNRNFLSGGQILTFNDADGRLTGTETGRYPVNRQEYQRR